MLLLLPGLTAAATLLLLLISPIQKRCRKQPATGS
jgi:UPF0716 family protein affecting phage T7 exclusion